MKKDNKKYEYKLKNEEYLTKLQNKDGIIELRGGVLCEYIKKVSSNDSLNEVTGTKNIVQSETKPGPRSIVTCHYKGSTIDGRVFDETYTSGCPAAFRVNELIPGFQIALVNMSIGDHCRVYIPSNMGYGNISMGRDIPANSTLIFEIELIAVG